MITTRPPAGADPFDIVNAAGALLTRHEEGEAGLLAQAADLAGQAAAASDDGDVLRLCAKVLLYRADETASPADWVAAELVGRRAVTAAEPDHPALATALGTLALIRNGQHLATGDRHAVREALELSERAVHLPAEDDEDRLTIVQNLLAFALSQPDLPMPELERVLVLSGHVLGDLPATHPGWTAIATNHSLLMGRRARARDSVTDFDESVGLLLRIRDRTTDGDPVLLAHRMSNLGASLSSRFERFGRIADLDGAVEAQRIAHATHPSTELALAYADTLHARYQRLKAEADLRAAESIHRTLLAEGSEPSTRQLGDFALILRDAFELTGDPDLANEALERGRASIRDADPDLAVRLQNLTVLLNSLTDTMPDLAAEAVATGRRAVGHLEDGHPDLPAAQSTLAKALGQLHLTTSETGSLNEAIDHLELAVAATPDDDPVRAMYLANLASAYYRRYRIRSRRSDRRTALANYRLVASARSAEPEVRQEGARAQGYLSLELGRHAEAASALGLAVQLQADVVPERLARSDVQRLLADARGLPLDAATLAIERQEFWRAAHLLELGRGVLLNRALGVRVDSTPIRRRDQILADAFDEARDRLDSLTSAPAESRIRAVEDYHAVLHQVRRVRGLGQFLRPPDSARLLRAASAGPVVLVNASPRHGDALVMLRQGVGHVPLPDFDAAEAEQRAAALHRGELTEADMTELLDWLWRVVVEPIRRPLRRLVPSGARLWWVPTGPLALLPLHAATCARTGDSALDEMVSSYTPTVTALEHARRRRGTEPRSEPLVLWADYPDAPLPGSRVECDIVAKLLGVRHVDATSWSTDDLLAALARSSGAHLAVHAVVDPHDPSAGGLVLPGGTLSIGELAELRSADPGLCYLSACGTTMTSARLADEAIHSTAALLLSGFRGVVGTFRSVPDSVARQAARTFYTALTPDGRNGAEATHRSVLVLRDRYRRSPSAWSATHYMGS
ncbi:CHAT domain-containing protein [Amycolatopsis sp. NPDC026612]|uniref:CHAT domain-containing protein n=1 Tax=Amycolatopsis sp. NPDC026612 TaxID=3155466 RepID=UPI0033C42E97